MTIQVIGPDKSTFDFPDGTPADTINAALSKHYGVDAAPADGFDRNDPALKNQFARSMLRGIPIAGAYANKAAAGLRTAFNGGTFPENLSQEDAAERAYEEEHPVKNFAAQALGGTAALGGVGGAVPGAARALGMTGRLLPAMRNATLSGGAISAADAAARGQPIGPAALTGAITGPASVLIGKGVGAGYDAAGRLIRGETPVQTRFETVNGRQVPVRESVQTQSPDTSRTEQSMIASGVPAAIEGEQATADAMQAARGDVSHQLGSVAGGPPQQASATSLEAGQAVADDLMQREQARAAAEVQRGVQAAEGTRDISSSMDQVPFAPAPEQPQQVGNMLTQRIQGLFQTARGATRAAYGRLGQTPGEFNPARMLGAGEDIRMALNSGPDRVNIKPDLTPQAAAMLQDIDREIAGLSFTNDAARGPRPITADDMEQVRKELVARRRVANNMARTTGNWEDARATGRVIEGFNDWLARVAQRPGGFSGNPQELLGNMAAARAQHADERAAFSRRGPGDKVGTMMEQIIGKYPGQEMSPDKIIKTLLGTPKNPVGSEQAVSVLDHLRHGLGEASPEWAGLRKAAINMLTQAGPGEAPLSLREQGENVQRFLGNERQAGALFDQGQRARLAAHANHLLAAEDVALVRGSLQAKIDQLSGRLTGEAASPEKIVRAIKGDSQLAEEVMRQVTPRSRALIKQALWRDASEGLEDGKPWGPQKTQTEIAKLLASPVARAVYTPNERMLMSELARAYGRLVPIPGSVNTSGTAHMQQKLMGNVSRQLLRLFGLAHGGLHGLAGAEIAGHGVEWISNRLQNNKAQTLFKGPRPARSPSRVAQIAQAQIARQGPLLATGRGDDQ